MQHLTIAWMTSRKDPKFGWFIESLKREIGDYSGPIKIVVVDFWIKERGSLGYRCSGYGMNLHVMPPKPSVWQGEHRLTKENYFAAASARNTALCHAPDGWIVYCDDLSVLMPGWFNSVKEAIHGNYIALGAYKKVKKLGVENGLVKSFEEHPIGNDARVGDSTKAIPCQPNWLYGCSLAAPIEAFLKINGWPEICDGMGYEDAATGLMISKHGYQFRYDRRMMTYESEELHAQPPVFKRWDPGQSPKDKSHAMLEILGNASSHPGYFGEGGIRTLRQHILNGGEFPIMKVPEHEWFTGRRLSEL